MWAGCVPAACAIGEGAVCRRAALCPHAGMYGDYVSWLADGKSAKVMKAHELVDADCRCAALPRPALPRAGRAFPCRAALSPLPAWELREASHLPRGNDETTKMMPRRVRTSRAEEILLHVSLLPSARQQLATRTTPRAPGLGRALCPPATPADSIRRRGKSVDRRLARPPPAGGRCAS